MYARGNAPGRLPDSFLYVCIYISIYVQSQGIQRIPLDKIRVYVLYIYIYQRQGVQATLKVVIYIIIHQIVILRSVSVVRYLYINIIVSCFGESVAATFCMVVYRIIHQILF